MNAGAKPAYTGNASTSSSSAPSERSREPASFRFEISWIVAGKGSALANALAYFSVVPVPLKCKTVADEMFMMTPSVEFLAAHPHGAALFPKSYTFPQNEKKSFACFGYGMRKVELVNRAPPF